MKLDKFGKYISGYFERADGSLVVFMRTGIPIDVKKKLVMKLSAINVRIIESDIMLMHNPISVDKAMCSPPIGGYTCHHCVAPKSNRDSTGLLVDILDPKTLEKVDTAKVVKDFPFKPENWFEAMLYAFLSLFGVNKYVNKYDFALLDKTVDVNAKKAGVLFAGTLSGDYAIFYNLANVPIKRDDVVDIEKVTTLKTFSFHYESRDFYTVLEREYTIEGKGAINVYVYDTMYRFEPVYYAVAKPVRACVGDICKDIKVSALPGYSGSVGLVV